jgi:hypothetical protein
MLLTKDEFVGHKKSDTIAIMGCGFSINTISKEEWKYIDSIDSIGMNWFCKLHYPTTWYLIREQSTTKKRCAPGLEMRDFLFDMAKIPKSIRVIKDTNLDDGSYMHACHPFRLGGDWAVFKELRGSVSANEFRRNIFTDGIHHGKGTMYDVLNFSLGMGYKKIIFFGVDLYDSRYFWLDYDTTLNIVAAEGRDNTSRHRMSGKTVNLLESVKKYWDVEMSVHNSKSEIAGTVPVWGGVK